jgi:hypothetical protein
MGFNTQFEPHPEKLHITEALPNTTVTSATGTNGTDVTIGEAEGNIAAVVQVKLASAGTNPTCTITVEHRVDSTDSWAAIPAAALINPSTGAAATFGVVTDAANGGMQKLGLVKAMLKAHVRLVATVAGTSTPTFQFSGVLVFSDKYGDQ